LSAAAGIGFVASLFGYTLSSARIFAVQPTLLVAALTVLVACCTVLVPRHGTEGAACALAIAYSVHAFLSWWVLRRSPLEARKIADAPRTQAA
jgi:Na+-driven multidrug efflux pump